MRERDGWGMDRRSFLKVAGGSAVWLGVQSPGSLLSSHASAVEVAKELRWFEYSHIQKPYFYEPFEKATGIKLILGAISNDDMTLAKMKAGGTKDWDVFHMGDLKNHPLLMEAKLVRAIDYEKIPNSKKILPVFKKFVDANLMGPDKKLYGLPNRWGVDTIAYRTDKMGPPQTVKVMWDEKYKGKITMPDYPLYSIIYAAQYLEYPRKDYYRLSAKQLQECKRALISQKKLLKAYWLSDADVINLWTSNEIWIAGASWAGTMATLWASNFPVQRVIPKEPAFGFINIAYISVGSPPASVEAAYKFLDYMIGPLFGQQIGLKGSYATVTTLGQDMLPANIKKMIFLDRLDKLGEQIEFMTSPVDPETNKLNYDQWIKLWNEVKAT